LPGFFVRCWYVIRLMIGEEHAVASDSSLD
jgi:hypothetical protein